MTSFKRTQRKYVQKAYRVRNWREYETGLRARGSLTVWLGLTDGKLGASAINCCYPILISF